MTSLNINTSNSSNGLQQSNTSERGRAYVANGFATEAAFRDLHALLSGANADGLSPMMLIALAERELEETNGQLKAQLSEIQGTTRKLSAINKVVELLESLQLQHGNEAAWKTDAPIETRNGQSPRLRTDNCRSVNLAEQMITLDSGERVSARQLLEDAGVDLSQITVNGALEVNGQQTQVQGALYVNGANMDSLRGMIRARGEALQQGSEIRQMRLQEIVSRRGQIVQLTSQVMAAMNETVKQIISNTRG